jgi:hypothetical protein
VVNHITARGWEKSSRGKRAGGLEYVTYLIVIISMLRVVTVCANQAESNTQTFVLSGSVRGSASDPIPNATITATPQGVTEEQAVTTMTAADGTYLIRLKKGIVWRLKARAEGHSPSEDQLLGLNPQYMSFVLEKIARPQPVWLSGAVRDCSGNLIPNATVTATPQRDGEKTVTAQTTAGGTYMLQLSRGITWELQATAEGYAPSEARVELDLRNKSFVLGKRNKELERTKQHETSCDDASSRETAGHGIQPLNARTYAEAISDVGMKNIITKDVMFIDNRMPFAVHGEDVFLVAIDTPYSRAAQRAWEAKRRLQPIPVMSLATLNSGQVRMRVGPGSSIRSADAIENVYIKRQSKIIKPLRLAVKPTTVRTLMGARRTLTEGEFVFPVSAFDPSEAVAVVLVGKSDTHEWIISADDLARMR